MDPMFAVIPIVVLVVVLGAIGIAAYLIRRKAREVAQMAFGTDSLLEGFKKMETDLEITPKSVATATNLFLPQITRDFPEFNFNDMKVRAENVLKSYLMAIDARDASVLTEGSRELYEALKLQLDSLRDASLAEEFDQVKIHRTEICRYQKGAGRCTVVFQSAVQFRYACVTTADTVDGEGRAIPAGTVLRGGKGRLTQSRYNVELVYVQDRDRVEDERDRGEGLNCPNCGAPITNTGQKLCAYCGTVIVPFNIRVWAFHRVTPV